MDPEQRLLVIMEYSVIKLLILLIGTLIWMLCPKRSSLIDWLRSLRCFFGRLSFGFSLNSFTVSSLLCSFLSLSLFFFFLSLLFGLIYSCLLLSSLDCLKINRDRHERTVLVKYFLCTIFIAELVAVLI